ncbi:hypothetical protein [Roseimaritima sediminicola]|uniref:hypothetical protein n=1 Tax=Roseimaritima sediminicola TaxID=2662066 RepID=UPI00129837EA|nr:hypothetical protein [Roseimaritima sediminicola]
MPEAATALKFQQQHFDEVSEGHLSLKWNEVEAATEYRVVDERDVTMYRGHVPQAFISGLADGEHRFEVFAVDARGEVLAETETPATVHVQHWSLTSAFGLFACGAVVLVSVLLVLLWGARHDADGTEAAA